MLGLRKVGSATWALLMPWVITARISDSRSVRPSVRPGRSSPAAVRARVCRAPHHLAVTMAPGTAEETVIEATLTAEEAKTRLVIEERGLPVGELAAHGAGWQAHVEDLTAHVQGRPAADWKTRWTTLTPAYTDLAARG